MLWTVDGEGRYRVVWESSYYAKRGLHRFVVTAKRYRLTSKSFRLGTSNALIARTEGKGARAPALSQGGEGPDITSRPPGPDGGVIRLRVGSRVLRVEQRHGSLFRFPVPAASPVKLVAARDRHYNSVGTP